MTFLCLIYLDEQELDAMPEPEMSTLNAAHVDLNQQLEASGHMVAAEALQPVRQTRCVRVRDGKVKVTDGPFAEAKEMVAGFYLIEARDFDEAVEVASRIPSVRMGTIEVRPTRRLIVDGKEV